MYFNSHIGCNYKNISQENFPAIANLISHYYFHQIAPYYSSKSLKKFLFRRNSTSKRVFQLSLSHRRKCVFNEFVMEAIYYALKKFCGRKTNKFECSYLTISLNSLYFASVSIGFLPIDTSLLLLSVVFHNVVAPS